MHKLENNFEHYQNFVTLIFSLLPICYTVKKNDANCPDIQMFFTENDYLTGTFLYYKELVRFLKCQVTVIFKSH